MPQEINLSEYRQQHGRNVTGHGSALFLFDEKEFPLEPIPDGPKQNEECFPYLHGAALVIAKEALNQGLVVKITDRSAPWSNSYASIWDFSLDVIATEDLSHWS